MNVVDQKFMKSNLSIFPFCKTSEQFGTFVLELPPPRTTIPLLKVCFRLTHNSFDSVEKVQVALRELETKYQEVSHTASLNIREKDNVYEVEKSKLAYKMAELTEDTNKKALQREMQLREESQKKFSVLEKVRHCCTLRDNFILTSVVRCSLP